MQFWQQVKQELANGQAAVLMYVLYSEGSSPGRQGFKMVIGASGLLCGSIGGGMMEYKLVEYCRAELEKKPFAPFLKKQIHRRDIPADRSGMICSGEQTIAFYYLDARNLPEVEALVQCLEVHKPIFLTLDNHGISVNKITAPVSEKYSLEMANNKTWRFTEDVCRQNRLYVVGAGHVSLALCRMAALLDFALHVLDDRSGLNTSPPESLATYTRVSDYADIAAHIPEGESTYVVLMSFGYRIDKIVLKNLLGRNFRYLGMMGSAVKVQTLFAELEAEGVEPDLFQSVHTPIGLPIHSQTPAEIAVSILAELIREKNRPIGDFKK